VANEKFPEEYMKLWNQKRKQISEKWEFLLDIKLPRGENILAFDVLKSGYADGRVEISIFVLTTHSKYYVFQTSSKLHFNLKSESNSSIVHQGTFQEDVLQVYSQFNGRQDKNEIIFTALAEYIPSKHAHVEAEEEEDIFSQFTRRKSTIERPKNEKPVLAVKLFSISEEETGKYVMATKWKGEVENGFKFKEVVSKISKDLVCFMTKEGEDEN